MLRHPPWLRDWDKLTNEYCLNQGNSSGLKVGNVKQSVGTEKCMCGTWSIWLTVHYIIRWGFFMLVNCLEWRKTGWMKTLILYGLDIPAHQTRFFSDFHTCRIFPSYTTPCKTNLNEHTRLTLHWAFMNRRNAETSYWRHIAWRRLCTKVPERQRRNVCNVISTSAYGI